MHKKIKMPFLKNNLFLASLFVFILCSTQVSAQVHRLGDQTGAPKQEKTVIDKDSMKIVYFHDKLDSLNTTSYYPLDTLITNFQHYHPNFQPGNPMASQGNIGEASYPLIFKPIQTSGFDFGRHSFDPYLFFPEDITYYKPHRPFTVLYYVSGKSKEQVFQVTHSQSIAKGLYVGVDYRLTNSLGNYDRQQTDEYSLDLNFHYSRPEIRYRVRTNLTTNLLKVNENGGLADLSYFEDNKEKNRVLLLVNLTDASNFIHKTAGYYHHSFYLGKLKQTRVGNSFWNMIVNTFNAGTIGHIFQYEVTDERYTDNTPKSNFYNSTVNDTIKTHDSLNFSKIKNTFYWTNQHDSTLQALTIKAGIRYELDKVDVRGQSYSFNQASPFGQFTLNAGANVELFGKISLTTGGYNDGDQDYSGGLRTHFGKTPGRQVAFEGEIFRTQTAPGYFYHLYRSNIDKFNWNNSLVKVKNTGITASLDVFGFKAGFNFYNISDFVYLDTASIARQSSQTANIIQISADYSLHLGGLTFRNAFTGQNIAGTSYIRLPQLVLNSILSYKLDMFKSALQTDFGIEMLYTSAYKGDAYNPALNMYRLQDNTTIGNYPYIDFFANLKMKHTRFFLKYQHANAGYMQYRYYLVPGYPQNDSAFKFGLSWIFYN
jgi:hypothetical protein